MKLHIADYIRGMGHEVTDFGADGPERADYPVFAKRVADAVVSGQFDLGVLICGTGVGISIAANKVKGARACCCSEPYTAKLTRAHNNANIVAFGARVIGVGEAEMIVDAFLNTEYEGGRHQHRVDMIAQFEDGSYKE
ncbi:MAG: ribose 5-phosphate isomerase B [Defluviitaleaceae bacterium]|nr:ribose 5-phosphate isomerase B [Defluviitaleaceae bacterium]